MLSLMLNSNNQQTICSKQMNIMMNIQKIKRPKLAQKNYQKINHYLILNSNEIYKKKKRSKEFWIELRKQKSWKKKMKKLNSLLYNRRMLLMKKHLEEYSQKMRNSSKNREKRENLKMQLIKAFQSIKGLKNIIRKNKKNSLNYPQLNKKKNKLGWMQRLRLIQKPRWMLI